MKALVLAGGEGTRLRPLTIGCPKGLVPVVNRPFLERFLSFLAGHGINEVVLALHYRAEAVQRALGDGSTLGMKVSYSLEDRPLGTAGAIKRAEAFLTGTFLVCNGDIFTTIDLSEAYALHWARGALATLVLIEMEDPTAYGMVETTEEGRVLRFVEKPRREEVTTHWVNGGFYILDPQVLSFIPPGETWMVERDLFPRLLGEGLPLYAYKARGYWRDLGTPAAYLALHRDILRGAVPIPPPGQEVAPGVYAEEGCRVSPRAEVRGPVVLGRGCVVREGACLRGPLVLGEGCTVEEGAGVEGAVLWRGCRVGPGARLRECILGEGVVVGAGAVVEEGCVLGGGAVLGPRTHLLPGTRVDHGARL